MTVIPRIPQFTIGEPGSAALVEGSPAMLLAQQPDSMIDAGVIGPLTIRAASIRGVGHRYDGTPRQDDFCLGTAGAHDDWLVGVVADGVSAGERSHIAARVAVRVGVQLVSEALAQGPPESINWDELVGTVAGHVLLQARKEQGDPMLTASDAAALMATTAAFVILPLDAAADGSRTAWVLPIGDTSVWVLRADGSWHSVTAIKNAGEAVASSAVFALPLLPTTSLVPLGAQLQPGDAIFVVTDGVGDPLGDGDGQVGGALAEAWATPPNRYEFAAQVDFGRRSHTDDRTVLAIWPDRFDDVEPAPTSLTTDAPLGDVVDLAPPDPADAAPAAAAPAPPPPPVEPPLFTTDPVGPEAPTAERAVWQPTEWKPTPWKPSTGSGPADE